MDVTDLWHTYSPHGGIELVDDYVDFVTPGKCYNSIIACVCSQLFQVGHWKVIKAMYLNIIYDNIGSQVISEARNHYHACQMVRHPQQKAQNRPCAPAYSAQHHCGAWHGSVLSPPAGRLGLGTGSFCNVHIFIFAPRCFKVIKKVTHPSPGMSRSCRPIFFICAAKLWKLLSSAK